MKFKDETDAAYIVRQLQDNFNATAKEEARAMIRREEAFEALMLAERARDYLETLAKKKAGPSDAH